MNNETHMFLTACKAYNSDKLKQINIQEISLSNIKIGFISLFKTFAPLDFIDYVQRTFLLDIKMDDIEIYDILHHTCVNGKLKHVIYIYNNIKISEFVDVEKILKDTYNHKKLHILSYFLEKEIYFK